MLSVHEALERVMASVVSTPTEVVNIEHAGGRVLRESVMAESAVPPWNSSAMDGYAIATDAEPRDGEHSSRGSCFSPADPDSGGAWFDLVGTAAAGHPFTGVAHPGQAVKIMTGAPLPHTLNTVVMSEHATEVGHRVQVHSQPVAGQNVRRRGEVATVGDCIAKCGTTVTPPLIGACATVGCEKVSVARRPRVGIISTGDELVPPGAPLADGQIYSSNSLAISGWVREAGGIPIDCGHARDDRSAIVSAVRRAADCDAVVTTGGVSVGDFDFVNEAFLALGAIVDFWKVAMKPGKPLALGRLEHQPFFGLPGNPVSAQVTFLQFVWPWLRASMGCVAPFLPIVPARTGFAYRKKPGRTEFVRVTVQYLSDGLRVHPTGDQGSGNPLSMAAADGLMVLAAETEGVHAGDSVNVQLLNTGPVGASESGLSS